MKFSYKSLFALECLVEKRIEFESSMYALGNVPGSKETADLIGCGILADLNYPRGAKAYLDLCNPCTG